MNTQKSNQDTNSKLRVASRLYSLGDYDKAQQHLSLILENNPKNVEALHLFGLVMYRQGDVACSIRVIKRALANNIILPEAYFNLGNIYRWENRIEEAIVSYANAIKQRKNYTNAYLALSKIFAQKGMHNEAIGGYNRVLKMGMVSADIYFWISLSHISINDIVNAMNYLETALKLEPENIKCLNSLAHCNKMIGDRDNAIEIYKCSIQIDPKQSESLHNLGNLYREGREFDKAIKCYEASLNINSKSASTVHFLNALKGITSEIAPRNYVTRVFDNYADKFEEALVSKLCYTIPEKIKSLLLEKDLISENFNKMADLGCGTGLTGFQFRENTNFLIGIDLSSKMLAKAKEKNVYDQLLEGDIINELERIKTYFDIFICTDVMVYYGNLLTLLKCVKRFSKEGALFIFSTETYSGVGYKLNKSGRFSHSNEYICSVISETNFDLIYSSEVNLRKEYEDWVLGEVYILRA